MAGKEYATANQLWQALNSRGSPPYRGMALDLAPSSAAELTEQARAAAEQERAAGEALPFLLPRPIERTGYSRQVARAFEQGALPRPRPPTMSPEDLASFYGDLGLELTSLPSIRRGVYGIGTGLITGRAAPALEGLGELAMGAAGIAPFVGAPARALRAKRFRVKKTAPLAVKRATAAAKAAAETDFRIPAYAVKGVRDDGSFSEYDSGIKGYARVVENVPMEWLRSLPGNELRHGEDTINQYAQSILDNGLSDPLIINVGKNTGTAKLGEGNHRLEAMRRAGFTHSPARVNVGSQYGSDLLPRSNFRDDLIPQAGEYFSSDASPSSVFKSLKGVIKAHGGRVSPLAVKRKGKK